MPISPSPIGGGVGEGLKAKLTGPGTGARELAVRLVPAIHVAALGPRDYRLQLPDLVSFFGFFRIHRFACLDVD